MSAVVSVRRKGLDRSAIAAQFVRDRAEPVDQRFQNTPRGLGIAPRLNKDIQNIAAGIHRTPQPILRAIDWDHDFIEDCQLILH